MNDTAMKIRHVSGALITRKGDKGETLLLVIKRAKDDHWPLHWELPRGGCDDGEPSISCLKREVKEETGLDIKPIKFLGIIEYISKEKQMKSVCKIYHCVLADENQSVVLSDEHSGYKWITSSAQAELLLPPDMSRIVSKAINKDIRIYDEPGSLAIPDKVQELLSHIRVEAMHRGKNVNLEKPFRLPKGSTKKFGVYVKNDKGNIVLVRFGDPNMEIKRDNPNRLKSFRSRHNCKNPGPKWKARYWSCKFWEKNKPVSKLLKK